MQRSGAAVDHPLVKTRTPLGLALPAFAGCAAGCPVCITVRLVEAELEVESLAPDVGDAFVALAALVASIGYEEHPRRRSLEVSGGDFPSCGHGTLCLNPPG